MKFNHSMTIGFNISTTYSSTTHLHTHIGEPCLCHLTSQSQAHGMPHLPGAQTGFHCRQWPSSDVKILYSEILFHPIPAQWERPWGEDRAEDSESGTMRNCWADGDNITDFVWCIRMLLKDKSGIKSKFFTSDCLSRQGSSLIAQRWRSTVLAPLTIFLGLCASPYKKWYYIYIYFH